MDEGTVIVAGPNLIFPNGKILRLEFGVEALVDFGDVIVVCLDVPPYVSYDENVFGIAKDGSILWRIKPLRNAKGDSVRMRYVGCGRDGVFARVNRWDGVLAFLDPRTGEVDHAVDAR